MKVLVTGGAGSISSHLYRRLLDEGYEVICPDNLNPHYAPNLKRKNIEIAASG
ncbi:MAG: NAD-dependent epimerase/dehydratase family protein [Dehalococcoidia bacterium]